MSGVAESEGALGLVVHLDANLLRELGGSSTNAELSKSEDRAVERPHYFLILDLDDDVAVATPLFSKYAPGSEPLEEKLKSGLPDKWRGEPSYFSRWQHWRIPLSAIPASSAEDQSETGSRRMYATNDKDVLARAASWICKNRACWRPL